MTLPLFTPMRDIADVWLEEARAQIKQERAGMSDEQLLKLEKQIRAANERGDDARELTRTHYRETGASGG